MILSFARGVAFEPGSNRQGAAAPPAWAYLLPRLDDVCIVPVGRMDDRLRAGLAGWHVEGGGTVLLVVGEASADDVRDALTRHPGAAAFAPAGAADGVLGELETAPPAWLAPARTADGEDAPSGNARVPLWVPGVAAGGGGKLTKLQARALRVSGRLLKRIGFPGGSLRANSADDPTGVPLGPLATAPGDGAERALFVPPAGGDVRRVPAWIKDAASAAGLDLAGATWRMVPSRGFRSQKILFLVRPRAGAGVAVKVTQDAKYNVRLANEHAGLEALAALDGVPEGTFPEPLFVREHRGLVVVGEGAIDGEPFRAHCDATPACPLARDAMDWLESVAVASAVPATGGDVADGVGELVQRFLSIYSPGPSFERILHADLETLRTSRGLPTVLSHGDPGVWNLLVTRECRVAVLDWENAEPRGLPLWDLLYFLRTLGALAAEKKAVRWTPRVFARQFLEENEWSTLLEARVDATVSRLGFEPEVAPALLRTGLAAFAAREAWSLDPRRLDRGVSFRLLRAVVSDGGTLPFWRGGEGGR